jgi:WD40 repeat protein
LFGHAPSKVSNLVPSITCLVALGDGRRLVSGGGDDTVRVWVISSGDCEQTIKGEGASLLDDSARGSAITSLAEVL